MKSYLLRGVPDSIRQDGWWIEGIDAPRHRQRPKTRTGPARSMLLLAAALILLAYFGGESFPADVPSHSIGLDNPIE